MAIKELRKAADMTQRAFSEYLNIPKRTIEEWEAERRTPPPYVVELIEYKLRNEKKI
ncbi:MAG: helix-turn-helix domain-containing protein [Ruminococcus sp.]|nr:helix-turn-helix domain-containing protein [Ruminococcus sp.]